MPCRSFYRFSISLILSAFIANPALAAPVSFEFSGNIEDIFADNGSATYSGTSIGDSFSGVFTYGSTAAEASFSETGFWSFSGGAFGSSITDGSVSSSATNADIFIGDNGIMTSQDAADLTALTGIPLSTGTVFDEWTIESFTDSNIGYGVTFISLDSTIYNDLSYQAAPHNFTNNYIALFFVQELDNAGNLIYESFGTVNTVSNVPLPPAIWLFSAGVIGLFSFSRRKNNSE